VYGAGDFFKGLPDNAAGCFDVLVGGGESLFNDLIHDVTHPGDFISDVNDSIDNAVSSAGGAIDNFVEQLPGNVYGLADWATGGIPDDISQGASDAWDDLKGIF